MKISETVVKIQCKDQKISVEFLLNNYRLSIELKRRYKDYFHWKVKMHLHLMSLDISYVDCIDWGVHVLMKIATGPDANGVQKERSIPKPFCWMERER